MAVKPEALKSRPPERETEIIVKKIITQFDDRIVDGDYVLTAEGYIGIESEIKIGAYNDAALERIQEAVQNSYLNVGWGEALLLIYGKTEEVFIILHRKTKGVQEKEMD